MYSLFFKKETAFKKGLIFALQVNGYNSKLEIILLSHIHIQIIQSLITGDLDNFVLYFFYLQVMCVCVCCAMSEQ